MNRPEPETSSARETHAAAATTGALTWIVRCTLLGAAMTLAAITVLTLAAQLAGITFTVFAWTCACAGVAATIFAARVAWRGLRSARSTDRATSALLAIGALFGVVLALASNRLNCLDDYQYVPNARHHLEHPGEPMGFEVHYLDGGPIPFESHVFATSSAYEYARALISYFTGVDFLFAYYLIGAAIGGLLWPCALFLQLRPFCKDERAAVWGALATAGVVLLLGESLRAHGSSGLTRIYMGKILFLAVGLPWFCAVALEFLRARSRLAWVELIATALALAGLTPSALVLLPCFLGVLSIAHLLTAADRRQGLRSATPGLLGLAVVIVAGLVRRSLAPAELSFEADEDMFSFFHHARNVFGAGDSGSWPWTLIVFVPSAIGAATVSSRSDRRFLLAWVLSLVVFLLNPWVAPYAAEVLTTPWLYWRLFYLLPFPLVIGITVANGLSTDRGSRATALATGATLTLLVGLHFVPNSPSVFSDDLVEVGWPTYKVKRELVAPAQKIVETVPPGPMLAPRKLGQMVTMLRSGYPQIANEDFTFHFWGQRGRGDIAGRRNKAWKYVGGFTAEDEDFRAIVANPRVRSIVIDRRVLEPKDEEWLEAQGFTNGFATRLYHVRWRSR